MNSTTHSFQELLQMPICKMDGQDLFDLANDIADSLASKFSHMEQQKSSEPHQVFGIQGIAQICGCSAATASRIKNSGILDEAITQVGRKIAVDVDKAMELLKKNGNHRVRVA